MKAQPEFIELQHYGAEGKLQTLGRARTDSFYVNRRKVDYAELLSIITQINSATDRAQRTAGASHVVHKSIN